MSPFRCIVQGLGQQEKEGRRGEEVKYSGVHFLTQREKSHGESKKKKLKKKTSCFFSKALALHSFSFVTEHDGSDSLNVETAFLTSAFFADLPLLLSCNYSVLFFLFFF